jgi:hypothetical protein
MYNPHFIHFGTVILGKCRVSVVAQLGNKLGGGIMDDFGSLIDVCEIPW